MRVVLAEVVVRNDKIRDLVNRTATVALRVNAVLDLEQTAAAMVELEAVSAGKDRQRMHRVLNMVRSMVHMNCGSRSTAAFGGKKG